MSARTVIFLIFIVVTVTSPTVQAFPPNIDHEYPLMQYTKLISKEHFTAGGPLVVVLPLAEEDSTNKEVGYLIEELHNSGRWPILVYNVSYNMKGNMYTEIHQHGSYIMLIAGPCEEWEEHIARYLQQLYELSAGNSTGHLWNPRAKFVVSVMTNCTRQENKIYSRPILKKLWLYEVTNVAVLFLKSNEQAGNDVQQNTTDSAQGTYVELHTWCPYENSDRCSPAEGTVPVKVFTVQNVSDIRRSDIQGGFLGKNFHGCRMQMIVSEIPPLVNLPRKVCYKEFECQNVYEDGLAIEMLRIIGNVLNITLDFLNYESFVGASIGELFEEVAKGTGTPLIFAGNIPGLSPEVDYTGEYTRSYFSFRAAWYTPCALRYDRWSRFFNIFSVELWICFALSLFLAVITVTCISNYGHKSHLLESQSYSNIFSVITNVIAVSLSVSVNTQPRSAPLRLFFFCWVCYSLAISTVFQAYLTTFLIEPGYEEPIKTVAQMLKSERKFGYQESLEALYADSSDLVDTTIAKDAVQCPDEDTCFIWAAVYQNFTTILSDHDLENFLVMGNWTDENNKPFLCELEDGVVRTTEIAIMFRKRSPFFKFIDNILRVIIEGGIFMHIKKRAFNKLKMKSKFDVPTLADTYYATSITQLETAFYLLLLGYVLAAVCFVIEIMRHRYRSKGRRRTNTSL